MSSPLRNLPPLFDLMKKPSLKQLVGKRIPKRLHCWPIGNSFTLVREGVGVAVTGLSLAGIDRKREKNRSHPSTEAVAEEARTEETGTEQESPGKTAEGEKDQSDPDDDGSSSSESSSDEASLKYIEERVLKITQTPLAP